MVELLDGAATLFFLPFLPQPLRLGSMPPVFILDAFASTSLPILRKAFIFNFRPVNNGNAPEVKRINTHDGQRRSLPSDKPSSSAWG